jgi:hypothetical protein
MSKITACMLTGLVLSLVAGSPATAGKRPRVRVCVNDREGRRGWRWKVVPQPE